MKPRRDKKGRFTKAKAPPLDPHLVAQLGADRPAVLWTAENEWIIVSWQRKKDITEEPSGRI